MKNPLRIATRQSPLALWQAEFVKQQIEEKFSDIIVELMPITTEGDKLLDTSLAKIGGKGLFIKELEQALYDGRADIAVHSMKDMTVILPEGLTIAAVLARENPSDVFISNQHGNLELLPNGSIVGTSSLRRQAYVAKLRPDLKIKILRGNVNTRLAKLDKGEYDAILLAYAGVKRLNLLERVRHVFSPYEMLPAIGQGIIGIECHVENKAVVDMLGTLNHLPTQYRLTAERAMNATLEGGCQSPVAGFAVLEEPDKLWLRGCVAMPDASKMIVAEGRASVTDAKQLGQRVANDLLDQGAQAILCLEH